MKEPLDLSKYILEYQPKGKVFAESNSEPIDAKQILYGIMLGDMIGGPYEGKLSMEDIAEEYQSMNILPNNSHFSDDSVMSVAIYNATQNLLQREDGLNVEIALAEYTKQMRFMAKQFPYAGYGMHFKEWALQDKNNDEYQSFGDGAPMRGGVIGAMCEDVEKVIAYAALSAYPTHAHPEGMKGAIVVPVLVWMALHGYSKKDMLEYICTYYPEKDVEKRYWKPLHPKLTPDDLAVPNQYQTVGLESWTAVCLAFINFYNTDDYESCMRACLRYPCDTDTVDAIAGGIATAFYKHIEIQGESFEDIVFKHLDSTLLQWLL